MTVMLSSDTAKRPDKQLVAASFSRAALNYDAVAQLQREVADELCAGLPSELKVQRWLDIGCGTGYVSQLLRQRFADAQGIALDLAEGMLQQARLRAQADGWIAADAEALPLRSASLSLLASSLAVQWCGDFSSVLSEAKRVLQPGGVFAFSSLVEGTLEELRQSWCRVDTHVHVNSFRRFADYQQHISRSGLTLLSLQHCEKRLYFPDLRTLTRELKTLGAYNLNPGRPEGLTGRARMQVLQAAYEERRVAQGLPLSYQVIYGVLQKES